MTERNQTTPQVGLFVTCLVDQFRPTVGFAAAKLIEAAGCRVEVPMAQTCCGQPSYNSGDRTEARAAAEITITAFEGYDYVVAPSGSCAAVLKKHYPSLFAGDPAWQARAADFATKVHELVSFLVDVRGIHAVSAMQARSATFHDSCVGLRELGIRAQPRALLSTIDGLRLIEMRDPDSCCGSGGGLCAKYPGFSRAMAEKKTANISLSRADMLLAGELGCLMAMAGKLRREGSAIEVRHVAEVLAGMDSGPPIGGNRAAPPPKSPQKPVSEAAA